MPFAEFEIRNSNSADCIWIALHQQIDIEAFRTSSFHDLILKHPDGSSILNFTPVMHSQRSRHPSEDKMKSKEHSATLAYLGESQAYLDQSGIWFYIQDALNQLFQSHPTEANDFMANYFTSVLLGEHLASRKYQYVRGTVRNQVWFLKHLQSAPILHWSPLDDPPQETLGFTVEEFHHILQMSCTDFPLSVVEEIFHAFPDDPDQVSINTEHQFTHFALQWLFQDWLQSVQSCFEKYTPEESSAPALLQTLQAIPIPTMLQSQVLDDFLTDMVETKSPLVAFPQVRPSEVLMEEFMEF